MPADSDSPEARVAEIRGGGVLMVPISATFDDGQLSVRLVIDVADDLPICREYTVKRLDGGGLEEMTTEVARGVKIRELMAEAVASKALEPAPDGGRRHATTLEAIEAVVGPIRRRRRTMTDSELTSFVASYRERYLPGHATEFAESVFMSERQMWRWKRAAIERGLMEEGE